MARPFKIRGAYFYRQRVPADVKARVGKAFVKRSLATRDDAEARTRFPAVAAEFQAWFDEIRRGVRELTPRESEAIAGEIYEFAIKEGETRRNPIMPHALFWVASVEQCRTALKNEIECEDGSVISQLDFLRSLHAQTIEEHLAKRGTQVSDRSFTMLLFAVNRAILQASEVVVREIRGDYTPDPLANRFPKMPGPDPTRSFKALYAEYCAARKKDARKAERALHFFDSMIAHVGTDDMRAVTEDHLLAWRDKLQASGTLSRKTIRDGYLAHVKAFFAWARRQKKLPTDPSAEVVVEMADDEGKYMRGFTDAEAQLILGAALGTFSRTMSDENRSARRWVPWICAYAGARVNEITQLRPNDVVEIGGIWCLDLTPKAGTLKNRHSRRQVPIHPHLVEQGFLKFVQTRTGEERLFYDEEASASKQAAQNLGNKICEWVRGLGIDDPEVGPNHGWRHRFKTCGRESGMNPTYLHAIQGHAPKSEGDKYGVFSPSVLLQEILKYPRYQIEPLDNIDGRRKEVRARKKATAKTAQS